MELRERIARAIHDGPNAQAQYAEADIAPHPADECEWFDQYLSDADAVIAVLAAEKAKWQAEAWDKGYSTGLDYMSQWIDGEEDEPDNPYEKGEQA